MATETEYCSGQNEEVRLVQVSGEAGKLLSRIECSQLGFSEDLHGPYGQRRMVYADYTASGKSLSFIEDYIRSHVLPTYANTHTTTTNTGRITTQLREEARELIKGAVNCREDDVLLFVGSGCTGALHKLVACLSFGQLSQPPVVFVSPFEHHANLLPWRESGAEVVWIAEDPSGRIDTYDLERKLKYYGGCGRQLIGSLSAASNITGVLSDTLSLSALLHKYGALSLWDYASAAPYVKMDMNPLVVSEDREMVYKDAIFFSVHKFVGGPETPGVLVAKKSIFRNSSSAPSVPAGGTVSFVTPTTQHYWKKIELREEGGTPQIIGSIRAGLAVQLKETVGSKRIEEIEMAYSGKVLQRWSGMQELCVVGPHSVPKLPIFSFVVRHADSGRFLHHNFVSSVLNDVFGIQSRGGCMCAGPYAQIVLGIEEPLAQRYIMEGSHYPEEMREALKPGVTRVSFPYFMSEEMVDFIIEAVKMTAREGWKLLPQYDFFPETGTFRHCSVSENYQQHCPRLADISYSSCGEMVHHTSRPHTSTPSLKRVLEEAAILFERASEESLARSSQLAQSYSELMLLGKEMEEMRWFLVPYEANLYLSGSHPPPITVPFQPRDYERDDWYGSEHLEQWDKHWNPSYWEKVKSKMTSEGDAPVISRLWQLTIYPANQSSGHRIQLQPIRDELSGGVSVRRKKAFASLECLHQPPEEEEGEGALEHPGSPLSSGYSSEGEEPAETRGGVKKRGKRSRRFGVEYGEDTRQGKKCVVM